MLRTVRGQSARIVTEEQGKYFIELYANGKWSKACGLYGQDFETEEQARLYFENERNFIHS